MCARADLTARSRQQHRAHVGHAQVQQPQQTHEVRAVARDRSTRMQVISWRRYDYCEHLSIENGCNALVNMLAITSPALGPPLNSIT